jgi:hypothetical protein
MVGLHFRRFATFDWRAATLLHDTPAISPEGY